MWPSGNGNSTGSRVMAQPTVTAVLDDGPLKGTSVEVETLEGRPPPTLDLPSRDGGDPCRYCLDGWVQSGSSAIYTFLYRV
jgi:hypothetical protein